MTSRTVCATVSVQPAVCRGVARRAHPLADLLPEKVQQDQVNRCLQPTHSIGSLTLRLTEETLQKAVKEVKAYVSMLPLPSLGGSSSL